MIERHIKVLKTILIPAVLGMVFSCQNSIEEIDALTDPYNLPVQTTEKAEYVYSENGKIKNKLIATKLDRFDAVGEERIEVSGGFTFLIYDSLEHPGSKLTALNGVYYEKLNKFVATDSVELSNDNGEKLNTDRLVWLQDKDLVYSNSLVKITTQDGVLWGDSMSSNSTFDNYQLYRPRGELDVKENQEDEDL